MGNFRQSLYHHSETEFEHNGFVLHQKTLKILEDLGVDIDVVCTILEEEDIEARKYVLETLKPTRTLYNYLKGKIGEKQWTVVDYFGNRITSKNYRYSKYIKAIEALREYNKHYKELKCQKIIEV